MSKLQEQVDELLCGAFIGVCHTVHRHTTLAWHVEDDEERMQTIDDVIAEFKDVTEEDDLEELAILKSLQAKGVTEVVLIRAW